MTATLPLASFVGNGGAVTAAIVGGIRNFRISVTTSPRCLLSASSLPFRRKAFHRACLSGASLNSSVNARGRFCRQRCRALALERADYARGHLQAWLYKGIGSDANAIPEKSAQKIFRAADQILRAGRADAEDEEHKQ